MLFPLAAATATSLPAGQSFFSNMPVLPNGNQVSLALGSLSECETGGRLWPSAVSLCRHMLQLEELQGCSVVELGCGTGAVGIFAAAMGAGKVVLSDGQEAVLRLAEQNVLANGERGLWSPASTQVTIEKVFWGTPCQLSDVDLVLGSGVTYSSDLHKPLCHTLEQLLHPTSRAILAHEKRVPIPVGQTEQQTPDTVLEHFVSTAEAANLSVQTIDEERQGGRLMSLLEVRKRIRKD